MHDGCHGGAEQSFNYNQPCLEPDKAPNKTKNDPESIGAITIQHRHQRLTQLRARRRDRLIPFVCMHVVKFIVLRRPTPWTLEFRVVFYWLRCNLETQRPTTSHGKVNVLSLVEAFRGRGVIQIYMEGRKDNKNGWTMARNAPGSFAVRYLSKLENW